MDEVRRLAAGPGISQKPKVERVAANIGVTALFISFPAVLSLQCCPCSAVPTVLSLAAVASVFKQCAR